MSDLCTCGRVLRTGASPTGRVDKPWKTLPASLRVSHRLPTLSHLAPTGYTGSIGNVIGNQQYIQGVRSNTGDTLE